MPFSFMLKNILKKHRGATLVGHSSAKNVIEKVRISSPRGAYFFTLKLCDTPLLSVAFTMTTAPS